MIKFNNLNNERPYIIFREKFNEALEAGQKNIDAICISSFNKDNQEISSRFVNLKMVNHDEFIFFSNYNSPKSKAFDTFNQIAALIYWPSINVQIRMKAKIKKTSNEYNQKYFIHRSEEKNALAISSNQSKIIDSFDKVQENFKKALRKDDLKECPKYWGGFSFTPYEIEFWKGNEFRLNKRNLYRKDNTEWNHFILEP